MFQSTDTKDQDALIEATRAYVKAVSAVQDVRVTIEKVAGDLARARVEAVDNSTSPAFVFLRKQQGRWKGIDLGTGFDNAYYEQQGIPASLRV
jgi:hypothetical protein